MSAREFRQQLKSANSKIGNLIEIMMTGTKKIVTKTIKLVVDRYTRQRTKQEATPVAPAGSLVSSGEYRYYAGHSYFGKREATFSHPVSTEEDCWRVVLCGALAKFPHTEFEGEPLWYGDWKLQILCPSQSCVDLVYKIRASSDDQDELIALKAFRGLSCLLKPKETIEDYLASNKHVSEEY